VKSRLGDESPARSGSLLATALLAITGAGLWAFAASFALAAENHLVNAEFDPPVYAAGWQAAYGTIDWTSVDANGCVGSGAGEASSGATDVGTQAIDVGQCVYFDVAWWGSGVYAEFTYESPEADLSSVGVQYFSDTVCGAGGGSSLGMDYQEVAHGPGWQRVGIHSTAIPNYAGSISVRLAVEAYQTTVFEAHLDRVYAGPVPRMFDDALETGSTCRWSYAHH